MYKKKLLKLADFLSKKVKSEDFDMCTWCDSDTRIERAECGTKACALGWATACFPRSKLKLLPNDKSGYFTLYPSYGQEEGMHAGAAMFGISLEQSDYLFGLDNNVCEDLSEEKREAVKRIRKFVKTNGEIE